MRDWQLVRRYVDEGSEAAFAELSASYADLVYATCYRELRSVEQAQDASQAVFLLLARKAPTFRQRQMLSSWLFQAAVLTSKNLRRTEYRRMQREQRALPIAQTPKAHNADEEILLHDGLTRLATADRDAVVGRFVDGLTYTELASTLGVREDAVRMRVRRGLEKLRRYFEAHGVALSTTALVALTSALALRPVDASGSPAPSTAIDRYSRALRMSKRTERTMLRIRYQTAAICAITLLFSTGSVYGVRSMEIAHDQASAAEDSVRAKGLVDQMYAAYDGMQTFKCDVNWTEDGGQTCMETCEIARPGRVRFLRVFSYSSNSGNPTTQLMVSDGSRVEVDVDGKRKVVRNLDADGSMQHLTWLSIAGNEAGSSAEAGMPYVALGARPAHNGATEVFTLGQPAVIDGVDVDTIIATTPVIRVEAGVGGAAVLRPTSDTETVTYSLGHVDHLLRRLTATYTVDGRQGLTRVETCTNIEVNPQIETSHFRLPTADNQ